MQRRPPRGGTDIQTPLMWSLDLLNAQSAVGFNGAPIMPFVVLLTDGCVRNEREICDLAEKRCQRTRVLTFGIGPYCNWYFLKVNYASATSSFLIDGGREREEGNSMNHPMML